MSRSLALAVVLLAAVAGRPALAHDWNDAGIEWRPYEEGLAAAKQAKKPICLVVFTEWCPHCKNYSAVFHDPKVVAEAKRFVMIHVDKDASPDVSKRYAPDGEYIPRTFFLASDGTLDPSIHAPRERFKYFYDEHDPASLLAGMAEAGKKLR
ncbi:MAG TPA: thioredoxin family protein [Candidatus Binatia bacterium]|nr:thioredoxin family protein [Candidatus Binatia bacterium]